MGGSEDCAREAEAQPDAGLGGTCQSGCAGHVNCMDDATSVEEMVGGTAFRAMHEKPGHSPEHQNLPIRGHVWHTHKGGRSVGLPTSLLGGDEDKRRITTDRLFVNMKCYLLGANIFVNR